MVRSADTKSPAQQSGRQFRLRATSYEHMEFPIILRGCAILLVSALSLAGCHRQSITVDQLIERNTQAVGGRAEIEAIHSIRVNLHIVDPGFEVDGAYLAARPGRMRIDIIANGQHVYTEAFDGKRGWQWKGKGEPVDESAMATAALRHGVELPGKLVGLHELRRRGHHIELVGREKVEGINYYVLHVTLSDGYNTTLFLDPDSWLITRRRDVRPLHPDVDPTPTTIENQMSDFRRVGDLLYPFASTDSDLATGKVLETTTVRSITLNPSFDPSVFEKL
jgi:hypothetical protein